MIDSLALGGVLLPPDRGGDDDPGRGVVGDVGV
jgi:hypothetical protein